jgi:hypothetical protein
MSKKSKFPELKQEIKTREAASREIRKRIHATSGLDRYKAWVEKRSEGSTTRCLLLMYAMARGIPRCVSEPKYSPADHWWLQNGMSHMAAQRNLELSKEAIEQWLKAAPPVVTPEAEVAA